MQFNVNQKLYEHETIVYNKKMPKHSDIIEPLPSFVSSVKADVAAKRRILQTTMSFQNYLLTMTI